MFELGSVRQKIPCVFQTVVVPNAPSLKRSDQQSYRVEASDALRRDAELLLKQPSKSAVGEIRRNMYTRERVLW